VRRRRTTLQPSSLRRASWMATLIRSHLQKSDTTRANIDSGTSEHRFKFAVPVSNFLKFSPVVSQFAFKTICSVVDPAKSFGENCPYHWRNGILCITWTQMPSRAVYCEAKIKSYIDRRAVSCFTPFTKKMCEIPTNSCMTRRSAAHWQRLFPHKRLRIYLVAERLAPH